MWSSNPSWWAAAEPGWHLLSTETAHAQPVSWAYHRATNHSLESVRASRHVLDWPNQPLPYKVYTALAPIPLPPPAAAPAHPASAAGEPARLGRATLAHLCYFANGVIRPPDPALGKPAFRAAACTGALYHVELYLVCGPLDDLAPGVYHYAAHDHSLRQLREGDCRAAVASACGGEPTVQQAPVIIACTSTFWRNAWKYQARAYRHSFWDTGTILANLLAVAAARDLATQLVLGFADAELNALLDLAPSEEATICLVAVGRGAERPPPAPPIDRLDLPTQPLSPSRVDYPLMAEAHAATSLASGAAAAAWRRPAPPPSASRPTDQPADSAPDHRLDRAAAERRDAECLPLPGVPAIEQVILRRGSSRRFSPAPIALAQLRTLLAAATTPVPSDVGGAGRLCTTYLLVHAVDGLEPGAYVYDADQQTFDLLKPGDFRQVAGYLDLLQPAAGNAAVNAYALADPRLVYARLGERGYRAAQLEGAIQGGRLYLAAVSLGLVATGLTFFDDDVVRFFSPHAQGKAVMFLVALGAPRQRHGPG